MKRIPLLFALLLGLGLTAPLSGQIKLTLSAGALDTGPITGTHAEIGVGTSPITNLNLNLRAAYNYSEATQFSMDALYSFVNFKKLSVSSGLEYTYSLFEATTADGYLIPDKKMSRGCYGWCGNSFFSSEMEYGRYGRIAIPVNLELQIVSNISLYASYAVLFDKYNKIRAGLKYRFRNE